MVTYTGIIIGCLLIGYLIGHAMGVLDETKNRIK